MLWIKRRKPRCSSTVRTRSISKLTWGIMGMFPATDLCFSGYVVGYYAFWTTHKVIWHCVVEVLIHFNGFLHIISQLHLRMHIGRLAVISCSKLGRKSVRIRFIAFNWSYLVMSLECSTNIIRRSHVSMLVFLLVVKLLLLNRVSSQNIFDFTAQKTHEPLFSCSILAPHSLRHAVCLLPIVLLHICVNSLEAMFVS